MSALGAWAAASATSSRRRVIFNADDFGLAPGVTAGIIEAHLRGLVRSASLMVTTPGFTGAVAAARAHATLDLGIHLALTAVPSALPPGDIPSLVGADGRFPPLGAWLGRMARRALRPDEVELELRAQVARALATGLPFSHLDSHHHVHLCAPVAPIVARLAREHDIPFVRRVTRQPYAFARPLAGLKRGLLSLADARSRRAFDGLTRADAFRGVPFPTDPGSWATVVRTLPAGVTEFMCHPGHVDPVAARFDSLVHHRAVELSWLCDARVAALLERAGVATTSFSEYGAARTSAGGVRREAG